MPHNLRRRRQEKVFKACGLGAIVISSLFLFGLIFSLVSKGYTAFLRVEMQIPVTYAAGADVRKLVQGALLAQFPEAKGREERRDLFALAGKDAPYILRENLARGVGLTGQTKDVFVPVSSAVELFIKRRGLGSDGGIETYNISGRQFAWLKTLAEKGRIRTVFNAGFFFEGDSQEPEQAGVAGSMMGSLLTIIVCLLFAFPVGVATAIYLEEFAKRNVLTDLIEININNLAAVPSIIYGLLGLFFYIDVLGLRRSSALVGGLVLALLVLPVIVIATRNALAAVPRSIRFAALAMGATPVQVAFHHTFMYALPGILTGVVLSIARALGETSPLLLIGMVAFITDTPKSFLAPATTLPVQIYLWSNNAEAGFAEKTAAAILVLLLVLAAINMLASFIRQRFEIKWQ